MGPRLLKMPWLLPGSAGDLTAEERPASSSDTMNGRLYALRCAGRNDGNGDGNGDEMSRRQELGWINS